MEVSYTMVAEARGQRVLWFREFGSYQGEWLLLSRDEERLFVYRGSYGSCSGCDALQAATFGYSEELTPDSPAVQEFIADYKPFLEMKPAAALRLAEREGNLLSVLPRNRREWYDIDHEQAGRQLALIVKADAARISAAEILERDHLELRRAALDAYGAERFAAEIGAREVDVDREDRLMRLERAGAEPFAFLYLRDASTPRRYILRVAPEHQTVREARAASFGIAPERFELAQET